MKLEKRILDFLEKNNCDPDTIESFPGDWGNRSYLRVMQGNTPRIIMVCKLEDTGTGLDEFKEIGEWLLENGLSAPKIYNIENGSDGNPTLVLLEDFGNTYCSDYKLMSQCIAAMQNISPLQTLPNFQDSPVYEGHRRVMDWYVPCYLKAKNDEDIVAHYLKIWNEIESSLPAPQLAFAHMDFHPANFMHLPEREGVKQCGILDFQDGCIAPIAYDYTNLLKDIRKDVPQDIIDETLADATHHMSETQKDSFIKWYKFLCLQFHFRLVGQVIKLSLVSNRHDLMVYQPRITRYIRDELNDPLFKDLKDFFDGLNVKWTAEDLDIDMKYIARDAF